MAEKIKILFIATDFYQAGTERFMYEVDRIIDRNRFDISILSYFPLNASTRWKDYYYPFHQNLGSDIYFYNDFKPEAASMLKRFRNKLSGVKYADMDQRLGDFLGKYDVISIWGEYNYQVFKKILDNKFLKRCLVHIMNTRYQNKDIFQHFDKNRLYHFVSGFYPDELSFELQEFNSYRHTFLPLSVKVESIGHNGPEGRQPRSKKIGIFTRLSSHKPLDPFIYSFSLLLKDFPDAELHIFGSGDPEKEGMAAYVRHLHLPDHVFFRGHAEDLKQTALNENLGIVWFHGYHGIPGGFAGFDICMTGIPQVFWNFGSNKSTDTGNVFPMYNDLISFAERNHSLLVSASEAESLASAQYGYLLSNHDIAKNIGILEDLYEKTAFDSK